MPLRDRFDVRSWDSFVSEVDWRLTTAIERVFAPRPTARTFDAIADGLHELQAGLRSASAQEPDYRKLGVAIAYTFKYMPQRISSIAAALTLIARSGNHAPLRVLDLGSGTDATRVALDLSLTDAGGTGGPTVVTVEPSYTMQNFGKTISAGPGLNADQVKRYAGRFDFQNLRFDCPKGFDDERRFDCIVLSACLPYTIPNSAMHWNTLVREIVRRAAERCVVVVIEPQAKKHLLLRLTESFADTGLCRVQRYLRIGPAPRYDPAGLGPIVQPRPLPFLTNLLRRLSDGLRASPQLRAGESMLNGMTSYGIESWNSSRSECMSLVFLEGQEGQETEPGEEPVPWYRYLRQLQT